MLIPVQYLVGHRFREQPLVYGEKNQKRMLSGSDKTTVYENSHYNKVLHHKDLLANPYTAGGRSNQPLDIYLQNFVSVLPEDLNVSCEEVSFGDSRTDKAAKTLELNAPQSDLASTMRIDTGHQAPPGSLHDNHAHSPNPFQSQNFAQRLRIKPRRTSCLPTLADNGKPSSPVVISLEQLDSLRGLPLPLAASTVGISATAFKRACRRLGVTRWQYRRGPGRARKGGAAPTRTVAASLPRSPSGPGCSPRCQTSSSAGQEVDPELAGADGVGCDRNGLADWLGGSTSEAVASAAGDDDALVLEMLALPWP